MDLQQFNSIVSDIYSYFNTKMPNPNTVKLWHDKCRTIPHGDPSRFAAKEVMNRDSIPRNLAKSLWEGYETWKKMNADRIIIEKKKQKGKCDYCGSTGFIFSTKSDRGVKYKFVSRCPQCKNWIEDVTVDYPCHTKEKLSDLGLTVEDY
jgi:hypothetical protein